MEESITKMEKLSKDLIIYEKRAKVYTLFLKEQ
jgi:hypothetical protein